MIDKPSYNRLKKKRDEALKNMLNKKNIKVHLCQLLAYSTDKYLITRYKNIYVHAKVSFYDNAFILLGSANWNLRSMTQDSELDIAIEFHDDIAQTFREEIWSHHLNGQWQPVNTLLPATDKNRYYKPKEWSEQWEDLLNKNSSYFKQDLPLSMNLFPYLEDITSLTKSWKGWKPDSFDLQKYG